MENSCPDCGTVRAEGAAFCGKCGHRFAVAPPAPAPAPPAAAAPPPIPEAPPPFQPAPAQSAPPPRMPAGPSGKSSGRIIFLIAGVTLFLLGLYKMLDALGIIGRHRSGYSSGYSSGYHYSHGSSSSGGLIFLGLFVLALGVGLLAWGMISRSKAQAGAGAARSWPTVPGVITRSWVSRDLPLMSIFATGPASRTHYYMPQVSYRYTVDRDYEGDRLRFGYLKSGSPDRAQALLQPYPEGAQVMVHYDPANPAESVLDLATSTGSQMFGIVMGSIVAILGVITLFVAAGGH